MRNYKISYCQHLQKINENCAAKNKYYVGLQINLLGVTHLSSSLLACDFTSSHQLEIESLLLDQKLLWCPWPDTKTNSNYFHLSEQTRRTSSQLVRTQLCKNSQLEALCKSSALPHSRSTAQDTRLYACKNRNIVIRICIKAEMWARRETPEAQHASQRKISLYLQRLILIIPPLAQDTSTWIESTFILCTYCQI
jgi:hypothetical protein